MTACRYVLIANADKLTCTIIIMIAKILVVSKQGLPSRHGVRWRQNSVPHIAQTAHPIGAPSGTRTYLPYFPIPYLLTQIASDFTLYHTHHGSRAAVTVS